MKEREYKENFSAIEITFDAPVHLTTEHMQRLDALLGDICSVYEVHHPDRVMWPAGTGYKMLTNPFMVDDDHPMQFDEGTYAVECFERERFEGERQARPFRIRNAGTTPEQTDRNVSLGEEENVDTSNR